MLTDQNELRGKMKIQAERTDQQMNNLNEKYNSMTKIIEGQAHQIKKSKTQCLI